MCAFYDPVESEFYGLCVEEFLLGSGVVQHYNVEHVVELGVGSGGALCEVLGKIGLRCRIDGYEMEPDSYRAAVEAIEERGLASVYRVTNADFFESIANLPELVPVIANPPYLPIRGGSPAYPELSGGLNGNAVTNRIVESGFPAMMIMLSSFSDPLCTLDLARARGYTMTRWIARPLRMGAYSSRPAVRNRIAELASEGMAFVKQGSYLLAGITLSCNGNLGQDLSGDLISTLRTFAESSSQAESVLDGFTCDALGESNSW